MNTEFYKKHRNLVISELQGYILDNYRATNAKDFEILGRALSGCRSIAILDDGSLYNAYCYGKNRTNAEWRASELIDEAMRHCPYFD